MAERTSSRKPAPRRPSKPSRPGRNKPPRGKAASTPKRKRKSTRYSQPKILDNATIVCSSINDALELIEHPFSEEQIAKYLEYLLLIRRFNEEINLVSRVNVEKVLLNSLYESLVPLRDLRWKLGSNLLDLGSGGGFPGVPLAIAFPDLHVTLLDSRRAKTAALKAVAAELDLANISVVHDRAETYARHVEQRFDMVAVRAVGPLVEVAPWAAELLTSSGLLLAWKGPEGLKERSWMEENGWTLLHRLVIQPHRYILMFRRRKAES